MIQQARPICRSCGRPHARISYTGPERRSQPRSDRSDFLPALLVALYTTAALIAGVIAMEGLR